MNDEFILCFIILFYRTYLLKHPLQKIIFDTFENHKILTTLFYYCIEQSAHQKLKLNELFIPTMHEYFAIF